MHLSVDLRALHARVMEEVQERAARPSLLRLPFWVRLAVPLAAAAAVALVVTASLYRGGSSGSGGPVTIAQKDQPYCGTFSAEVGRPRCFRQSLSHCQAF